jgi:hypothetical protein
MDLTWFVLNQLLIVLENLRCEKKFCRDRYITYMHRNGQRLIENTL